jgi:uncharacterized lipoprotein NlpE involved in copper resistance
MRKIIFIVGMVCLLFELNACKSKVKEQTDSDFGFQIATSDNSRTSLDWMGTYEGVIPCADCSGIEVQITLNDNDTYQMSWKYQEKKLGATNLTGTFYWDDDGNSVTLGGLEKYEFSNQYIVGENVLILLDRDGNRITGDLADNYILTKKQTFM